MNKYDLEERLIEFSVLIIEIVNLRCEINRRFSEAISQGEYLIYLYCGLTTPKGMPLASK